jgi:hypothetical protein
MTEIQLTPAEDNELTILNLVKNIKVNFLEVGALLVENYNQAYWSMNRHESFRNFVEQLGIGSYSWCTRLMRIAEVVATQLLTEDEVLEIGVAKTCLLLPMFAKSAVDVDTIELAKNCPYHDLRIMLGQAKEEETEEVRIGDVTCPRCGASFPFFPSMVRRA